jgi:hypothetical protein
MAALESALEGGADREPILGTPTPPATDAPLAKLLRQPNTLLGALIVHEVLGPPRFAGRIGARRSPR